MLFLFQLGGAVNMKESPLVFGVYVRIICPQKQFYGFYLIINYIFTYMIIMGICIIYMWLVMSPLKKNYANK